MIRLLDSAGSTLVEWGRQQQHDYECTDDVIAIDDDDDDGGEDADEDDDVD